MLSCVKCVVWTSMASFKSKITLCMQIIQSRFSKCLITLGILEMQYTGALIRSGLLHGTSQVNEICGVLFAIPHALL